MSGPCTNCTDLTLGRQQHALFQTITFYYPLRRVSVKRGEWKRGAQLVPRLNASVAWPCFITSRRVCSSSAWTLEQVQRQLCSRWSGSHGGGQQFSNGQVAINHANERGQGLGWRETHFWELFLPTDFLPEELAKSTIEGLRFYLPSHPLLEKANEVMGLREVRGKGVQWLELQDTDSSPSLWTGCGMTLGEFPAFICSVFSSMKWD